MKAALVLLCLAAGQAAAHIFRSHRRPQSDWIVRSSDWFARPSDNWIARPSDYDDVRISDYRSVRPSTYRKAHSSESQARSSEEKTWELYSAVGADAISPSDLVLQGGSIYRDDSEHIFDDAYETVSHIDEQTKRRIHRAFDSGPRSEDIELNATRLLQRNGYRVEEHEVATDDGYLLTLIRIRGKGDDVDAPKPAVLLVHGLLGSADDWLLLGPGESLAYQMADAGFDVWLGNVRGSRYSRRHVAKHPAQPDFWQFGIDEIAARDLPAMIDRVLRVSQQKKLHYVGHSQGTTAFFAMAAAHPEHGRKVATMHALAPTVYMSHARSPLLRMISPASRYHEAIVRELGSGEFGPSRRLVLAAGGRMCEEAVGCEHVCGNVDFVVAGVDASGLDVERLPAIVARLPAGASARQIEHYGQMVAGDRFRRFDYGARVNERVYGQHQPPSYDMTRVRVPVALYYGEADWLAHPADVARLRAELPRVTDYYRVPDRHFGHMDFQFSERTPAINRRVVDAIVKAQNMSTEHEY